MYDFATGNLVLVILWFIFGLVFCIFYLFCKENLIESIEEVYLGKNLPVLICRSGFIVGKKIFKINCYFVLIRWCYNEYIFYSKIE
jgi:hypothetical protein